MAKKQKGLGEPKPPTGEWGACHSCDWESLTDPPSYGGLALHLSQGYPEGGGNITAAETSTMTLKNSSGSARQVSKSLPQAASRDRSHSRGQTDLLCIWEQRHYILLGIRSPPAARAERWGGMVIQSDGNKKLQPNPRDLLPGWGSMDHCGRCVAGL